MESNWAGLINELNDASHLLDSATNRYSVACANVLSHYRLGSSASQDLVDSALTELRKLTPYKSRFGRAEALLQRIRNQSPDLVPINTLPSEVLARAFWFLRSSEYSCVITRYKSGCNRRSVCPDILLRVCSRWRQVVHASHDLWSHIDIDACQGSHFMKRSLLRAEIFAAQSNQALLDLHFGAGSSHAEHGRTLIELFRSIAPRIQAFSLECPNGWICRVGKNPLLDTIFSGLMPGTLTRLHMHGQYFAFLAPMGSIPSDNPSIELSIAEEQLEELLAPVTSLNLKTVYPFWTSRAYWGLVELILDGPEHSGIDIKDHELAGILQASPALQIFRLGLNMRSSQEDPSIFIQLNSLELLELTQRRFSSCPGAVLRMIHPGQIPLEMCIVIVQSFDLQSPYWVEFVEFASRSSIRRLRVHGHSMFTRGELYFHPSEIFTFLPELEELVLKGLVLGQRCEDLLEGYDAISMLFILQNAPRHRLRLLDLDRCTIHWNDFSHMSEMQPTEKLVLDRCEVVRTEKTRRISKIAGSPHDWESDLKKVCPIVEIGYTNVKYEDPVRGGYNKPSAASDDNM